MPVLTTTGGFAYYKLGNNKRAIADYDSAIELDPKDTAVYISRGKAYAQLGGRYEGDIGH